MRIKNYIPMDLPSFKPEGAKKVIMGGKLFWTLKGCQISARSMEEAQIALEKKSMDGFGQKRPGGQIGDELILLREIVRPCQFSDDCLLKQQDYKMKIKLV